MSTLYVCSTCSLYIDLVCSSSVRFRPNSFGSRLRSPIPASAAIEKVCIAGARTPIDLRVPHLVYSIRSSKATATSGGTYPSPPPKGHDITNIISGDYFKGVFHDRRVVVIAFVPRLSSLFIDIAHDSYAVSFVPATFKHLGQALGGLRSRRSSAQLTQPKEILMIAEYSGSSFSDGKTRLKHS